MTAPSLADMLAGAPVSARTIGNRRCKVGRLLDKSQPSDREAILDALTGDRWTDAQLSRLLHSQGLPVADKTLASHRNRSCICDDSEKP